MKMNEIKAAAIILAAGGSRRLGSPKQLLDWFGKSFISQVVDTSIEAGLEPVIVVSGSNYELVEKEIDKKKVVIVRNLNWLKGQSTSMIEGVKKLVTISDKPFIFILADQPQISTDLIRRLIKASMDSDAEIVTTTVNNQPLPPILFKKNCIEDLLHLEGDQGGRKLINMHPTKKVESNDKGIIMDCDTKEDYERLKKFYNMRVAKITQK